MCAAGAAVDHQAQNNGATPLLIACQKGHVECVRLLCEAGAAVDRASDNGCTPLFMACHNGHVECVQLLSSYAASRTQLPPHVSSIEAVAEQFGRTELLAWLVHSRDWTPLHHTEILTAARARELLRAGASLHAGSPSPLDLVHRSTSDASALLRRAAQWSMSSHELFPASLRARALALLQVGCQLAWSPRFEAESESLIDAWRDYVLPNALMRT